MRSLAAASLEAVAFAPVSRTGQALHDFYEEVDDGVAVVGLGLDSVGEVHGDGDIRVLVLMFCI